jgi:hypothetical protein
MASYCYCGCGRKVRFAKKRFSSWGDEAHRLTAALSEVSRPMIRRSDPDRLAGLDGLIQHGRSFEAGFLALIHDSADAPEHPVAIRRAWEEWRSDARRIASSHIGTARELGALTGVDDPTLPRL